MITSGWLNYRKMDLSFIEEWRQGAVEQDLGVG